ncbi:MAG: FAD-dependent oxidoreductase [Desulfobacterales bacterium]|nr:FAD-dependent oxidoreductase [Desulfobacterales bacterium]
MLEKVTCQFCSSRCGMLVNIENKRLTKLLKAPCERACPAGIDVPRYIRFIADGKYEDAVRVIREKVPFPGVLGCVCHHPCEDVCRRGEADQALSIKALKDFVASRTRNAVPPATPGPGSGKKVAVVGSGPSGLTAAFNLTAAGHAVTVFEMLPEAGGMMRSGIPAYRLPKDILDKEIAFISAAGVEIKTNSRVDSVDSLLERGFDAVFVGTGATRGMQLDIDGRDDANVMDCVTFLRRANAGEKIHLGAEVAVLGGGYAAVDSARTALRLGAKAVTIIYRRTRNEMKVNPAEMEHAVAEGIHIRLLAAPHRISIANGRLNLECIEQRLGVFDESGRRRPEDIECSEFRQEFDTIIMAVGQQPDLPAGFGIARHEDRSVQVDPHSLATSKKGVFAGGDAVTGPASVIEAIAAGRQAAASIDKYLGGQSAVKVSGPLASVADFEREVAYVPGFKNRMPVEALPPEESVKSFSRVESSLTEENAMEEADRCYWCDLADGDPEHPLSQGWCCKRGRSDTARRLVRA